MGERNNSIILYTAQSDLVMDIIEKEGVCYSKPEYVRRKYEESSKIFLTAYNWYVEHARQIVPRPQGAEFPYWAYENVYDIATDGTTNIVKLQVPLDEVVLFDTSEWKKILCLEYLDPDRKKEQEFKEELELRGLRSQDVMLSDFYPEFKEKIYKSWENLFRYHEDLKSRKRSFSSGIQGGLWRIKKEWMIV